MEVNSRKQLRTYDWRAGSMKRSGSVECGGEGRVVGGGRRATGRSGAGRNIYSRRRGTTRQGLNPTAGARRFKRPARSDGPRFHFLNFTVASGRSCPWDILHRWPPSVGVTAAFFSVGFQTRVQTGGVRRRWARPSVGVGGMRQYGGSSWGWEHATAALGSGQW